MKTRESAGSFERWLNKKSGLRRGTRVPVESQMSTWIGSSFISVFLLFMGGILIGHLLWYRDRSRDLQAVKEAETKYNRAKAAARIRKRRFVLLSRDVKSGELASTKYREEAESLRQTLAAETQRADSLQSEMGVLHAEQRRFEFACRDAEKQRDAAREQVDTTATELASLRDSLRDTEAKLNAASTAAENHAGSAESVSSELSEQRERCVELAASHDALLAETREMRRQLETAESHREQILNEQTQLQHKYDQLRSRCDELIVHRTEAILERDEATEHRDRLVVDLESSTSQHVALVVEHDRIVNEHVLLVRERDALIEERDQLADRRTVESTAASHTDEKFLELQKEYDGLRDQHAAAIAANEDQVSLYESHQAEFAILEVALHESSIQVQTLQSEHDELLDQLDERTSRIQTAIDGRVTAETALSEMEARIESLLQELADANETRSHHEVKLAEVQSSGSELQSQATKLHVAICERDQRIIEMDKQISEQNIAINRHCAEAERLRSGGPKLKKLEETIAAKSAEVAEANANLQSSRDLAASLRSEIGLRDGQIVSLDQAQQQIRVQLTDQTALIARLEQELRGATARVEAAKQHEPRAAEFQQQAAAMQDQAAAMQAHSEDLQNQLDSLAAELEASLDANATMQQRVRQIEGQLHENAIAMRDLRRKRANVPALGSHPAREQNKAA